MAQELDLLNEKFFDKNSIRNYNLLQFNIVNPTLTDQNINLFYPYGQPIPQTNNDCTPIIFNQISNSISGYSINCYDTFHDVVWVANSVNFQRGINYYSTSNKQFGLVDPIIMPANFRSNSMAYSPDSKFLCIVGETTNLTTQNCVIFIDTISKTRYLLVTPKQFQRGCSVVYNSTKQTFYCTSATNDIYEVNMIGGTPTLLNTISAPAGYITKGIAYNASNNCAYITCDNGYLIKLNCTSNSIVNTLASPLLNPFAIAINTNENIAYVGSSVNAGLWIYDLTNDIFTTNIATNLPSPFNNGVFISFIYYPATDCMYAYDSNTGWLAVIRSNFTLLTYLATTPTTDSLLQIALSTSNNQVMFSADIQSIPSPTPVIYSFYSNNPVASPSVYITGTDVYDIDVSDWRMNPVIVRKIVMSSDNEMNVHQSIDYVYNDAFGNRLVNAILPELQIDVYQPQSKFTQIDFKDAPAVFGLYQWFENFTIKAQSTIFLVLVYHQTSRKNLLMHGMSACKDSESAKMITIPHLRHLERTNNDVCSKLTLDANRVPQLVPAKEVKMFGRNNRLGAIVKPFNIEEFNKQIIENNKV